MARHIGKAALTMGAAGVAIGAIASALVKAGNPGNMGVCVACFVRDTAGTFAGPALGMGGVAYVRPEILGIVLGAFAAAALGRELKFRGGGAFWLRFGLGFVFMSAALVFLGCTVRAWLRLAGGDLNALVGIGGLVVGVGVGAAFLKAGYSVGRSGPVGRAAGLSGPVGAALLCGLAVAIAFGVDLLTVTPAGAPSPGGKRAPLALALLGGAAVGVLAQRSRICTTGAVRDLFLGLKLDKAVGVLGLVAGALVVNVALGQFRLGFAGQPVAHTDVAGNFAAMAVAGLAAVLMGGCPLRQLVMSGEGDADASGALLGMFAGALFMHGTKLASSPKGIAPGALGMLAIFAIALLAVGFLRRERAPKAASGAAPQP